MPSQCVIVRVNPKPPFGWFDSTSISHVLAICEYSRWPTHSPGIWQLLALAGANGVSSMIMVNVISNFFIFSSFVC